MSVLLAFCDVDAAAVESPASPSAIAHNNASTGTPCRSAMDLEAPGRGKPRFRRSGHDSRAARIRQHKQGRCGTRVAAKPRVGQMLGERGGRTGAYPEGM